MDAYYLDTSALIKRYVITEAGHAWMLEVCDPKQEHTLLIAEIALVEAVAAFARMPRETPPRLSITIRNQLVAAFRKHVRKHYAIVRQTRTILTNATELCLRHPLRAYDAVQLASALHIRDQALALHLPPPHFLSADANLLAIAAIEGLPTDNPNNHPSLPAKDP